MKTLSAKGFAEFVLAGPSKKAQIVRNMLKPKSKEAQVSLREAATSAGIDPRTVLRYVGSALEREGQHGEYRATPHDQIPRSLHFITPQGTVVITVKDSRTASRIAEHMNAVRAFTNSGDLASLDAFKGETFEADGVTYMFVTDPATLGTLADAGVLSIDRLYRSVLG